MKKTVVAYIMQLQLLTNILAPLPLKMLEIIITLPWANSLNKRLPLDHPETVLRYFNKTIIIFEHLAVKLCHRTILNPSNSQ